MLRRGIRLFAFSLLAAVVSPIGAQEFDFPPAAATDTAVLASYMPKLASEVMAVYHDGDRRVFLGNLFRLQTVAGRYAEAEKTLDAFARALGESASEETRAANVLYHAYASAMQKGGARDAAMTGELTRTLSSLDDIGSAMAIRGLVFHPGTAAPAALDGPLNSALRRQGDRRAIGLRDALALVKAYHTLTAIRALGRVARPIIAADDNRRYVIDRNIQVPGPEAGVTVCAMVVRKRGARRLPTLLNFTIYADTAPKLIDLRRIAANGYVGVAGFSRGKVCSHNKIEPYEHDGADAAALINWIAKQPWSDGRVGMYGGSYEGFTQWAAAKYAPPALKTITPAVAVAPGLDVPMEGNIVANFVYPWPFYVVNNTTLDTVTYNNFQRWNRLNRDWYVSGRAYRDLDKIDGTPNPVFDRWSAHPSVDGYWQGMIPTGAELARLNIPVLATIGYFFGGPGGEEYYFREHYRNNPRAQHYLVVGPYDHVPGQRGTVTALGDTIYSFAGYTRDPVALQDFWQLRFQWFDWIFKGGPKPPLLADKVNYEVMGANVWKHAPSISAMSDRKLRLYLGDGRAGLSGLSADAYRMATAPPNKDAFITETIDLANRGDIDRNVAGGGIVNTEIDTVEVLQFVSEPMSERTELSGLFSGSLDISLNKKDFDVYIALYELNAKGEYFLLSTWQMRASYARDLRHRELLTPGQRTRLDFTSIRLVSRMLECGSRIVALVSPLKAPVFQINLGSGKDVSDETVADAGSPLTIRWYADSFIDLPIRVDRGTSSCPTRGLRD